MSQHPWVLDCSTTRQGTPLWACAGHARAIHSWALNWNVVMPFLAQPWSPEAQQPEAMPLPHLALPADCMCANKLVEFPSFLWPRYIFRSCFSLRSCCFLSYLFHYGFVFTTIEKLQCAKLFCQGALVPLANALSLLPMRRHTTTKIWNTIKSDVECNPASLCVLCGHAGLHCFSFFLAVC